jgi:hypothetical protein
MFLDVMLGKLVGSYQNFGGTTQLYSPEDHNWHFMDVRILDLTLSQS